MAEFICRLGTPAGEVVTRTVEAQGVQEARTRLEREGFRVFTVSPPRTSGVSALTRFGRQGAHPKVKANDFLLFNQQLAALVRAGIPILQAISMLRKRAASARLRGVLGDVEEQIRGGAALSQAFAAQGSIFPRIYTASILAGERSGALDEVLRRYVTYMRRNVALRRKIRGALAYPMFLLFASGCMVTFLTIYVVPKMSELFAGWGMLPAVIYPAATLARAGHAARAHATLPMDDGRWVRMPPWRACWAGAAHADSPTRSARARGRRARAPSCAWPRWWRCRQLPAWRRWRE